MFSSVRPREVPPGTSHAQSSLAIPSSRVGLQLVSPGRDRSSRNVRRRWKTHHYSQMRQLSKTAPLLGRVRPVVYSVSYQFTIYTIIVANNIPYLHLAIKNIRSVISRPYKVYVCSAGIGVR